MDENVVSGFADIAGEASEESAEVDVIGAVNALGDQLGGQINGLDDKVNSVLAAMPEQEADTSSVDYTALLENIQQLAAYADVLLVVLSVFVVLLCGMVMGLAFTRWLKARRE